MPCGKLEIIVRKAVCRCVNLNIDTKMKLRKKIDCMEFIFGKKIVMSFYSFWSRRVGSLLAN